METLKTIIGIVIFFNIIIAILNIFIFWLIIKSAVKAGINEALKENRINIDINLTNETETIKEQNQLIDI